MMELRPCAISESKDVSEFLYTMWHEVFDDMITGGYDTAEYIFQTWTNPDAIAESISNGYVYGYMFVDGKRAGVYSYHIQDDGRFYINKVYLLPQFRGSGNGNTAINMMLDIAKGAGCSEAYLNVYFGNKRAIRAYERVGFEKHYRCLQMVGNGNTRNDYIMHKYLNR